MHSKTLLWQLSLSQSSLLLHLASFRASSASLFSFNFSLLFFIFLLLCNTWKPHFSSFLPSYFFFDTSFKSIPKWAGDYSFRGLLCNSWDSQIRYFQGNQGCLSKVSSSGTALCVILAIVYPFLLVLLFVDCL